MLLAAVCILFCMFDYMSSVLSWSLICMFLSIYIILILRPVPPPVSLFLSYLTLSLGWTPFFNLNFKFAITGTGLESIRASSNPQFVTFEFHFCLLWYTYIRLCLSVGRCPCLFLLLFLLLEMYSLCFKSFVVQSWRSFSLPFVFPNPNTCIPMRLSSYYPFLCLVLAIGWKSKSVHLTCQSVKHIIACSRQECWGLNLSIPNFPCIGSVQTWTFSPSQTYLSGMTCLLVRGPEFWWGSLCSCSRHPIWSTLALALW